MSVRNPADDTYHPDDWFTQNAPPPPGPNDAQILAAYQQYLGRVPSTAELRSHDGNPGGVGAVIDLIKNSDEAHAYFASKQTPGPTTTTPPPTTTPGPTTAPGPTAPTSFGFDEALKRVQAAAGRTLSPTEIDALFTKFGGSRTSTFTDASLAPVIASLKGPSTDPGAGFGDVPPPYASNPNAPAPPVIPPPSGDLAKPYVAPVYAGDTPLPPRPAWLDTPYVAKEWQGGDFVAPTKSASLSTEFAPPTQAELEASPGYQARLRADQQVRERSAAARGSVLSGGTQVALGRGAQEFASNEYGNLYGQSLGTRQQNVGEYNTGFTNAFNSYLQKYAQFSDQSARDLTARQQNVGEYQTALGNAITANANRYGQFTDAAAMGLGARQQNLGEATTAAAQRQTQYQNQYAAWLNENARSLSEYTTNVATKRTAQNDYWSRLNDIANRGLTGAINARVA